jgi:alcohol dehydrogenase
MGLTEDQEFDWVIEAVGIPATFALCQKLVGIEDWIANVGVHGIKQGRPAFGVVGAKQL